MAISLDRAGAIVGRYHKRCPVTTSPDYSDFERGISPGEDVPVFDLDFGRIGIQICFDVGFPENWKALADRGARLVLWPSAYDGGFPLRAYAWLHHYYVVSSTRTGQSRIIDPNGEILMETSSQTPVLIRDINLDYLSCHWDFNMGIPDRIQKNYGDLVLVRQWDKGSAHFLVEPMAPGITCAQLQEEFGLESTAEYHERHRRAYRQIRQTGVAEPQKARHGNRRQYGKD